MERAYIFDIDGTLANCDHRIHYLTQNNPKDWDSFYEAMRRDTSIEATQSIARSLGFDHRLIFVTGRPERYRELTSEWLREHVRCPVSELHMRKDGDHRPDYVIKYEIYKTIKDKYRIMGVFEDRKQVVEMWRKVGLICYQCADGDY